MDKEDKIARKRKREAFVLEEMIRLYCRKNHKDKQKQAGHLCPACQELLDYAKIRNEKCPFMAEKTFCANCKIHCYKPKMKEEIRRVMRFCGPRMLLVHPILAVSHLICTIKERRSKV